MAIRQAVFANGQFYHLYNRSVDKKKIFGDKYDCDRFLEAVKYYNNGEVFLRFTFRNRVPMKNIQPENGDKILTIIAYVLMPNHFHLLVRQDKDNGISNYMRKLLNSYTRYYNTKYQRNGPLFEGNFRATRVENDEALVHLIRYIHLNPITSYLVKNIDNYPYSSHMEYINKSNYSLIEDSFGIAQFSSLKDYRTFLADQEDYQKQLKEYEDEYFD